MQIHPTTFVAIVSAIWLLAMLVRAVVWGYRRYKHTKWLNNLSEEDRRIALFYLGDQWTERELDVIKVNNSPPFKFNRIGTPPCGEIAPVRFTLLEDWHGK